MEQFELSLDQQRMIVYKIRGGHGHRSAYSNGRGVAEESIQQLVDRQGYFEILQRVTLLALRPINEMIWQVWLIRHPFTLLLTTKS